jgi:uncharacterized membrane protein YbhN (UPF0104 family)
MYRNQWRWVIAALVLSLVGHCCFVLTYYFAAQAFLPRDELGTIPSLAVHFLIVPVGMAVQGVVPIPGGLGVGEKTFETLYEWVGKDGANGVFMSFVYRVITWVLSFTGYIVYASMKTEVAQLQKEAEVLAHQPEPESNGEDLPAEEPVAGVQAAES